MFYEFSIQYDDPAIFTLLSNIPVSDVVYFKVTHAYPNWIPSHWPTKLVGSNINDSKDNIEKISSFVLFPLYNDSANDRNIDGRIKLEYHRYIHLFNTYLDSYLPPYLHSSPQNSISSLIVRIVSPLVPQGNWTTGANPPAPNEFFYRHFPKKSPDFDNDYHVNNPGIFWGWFHLTRWLPNLIQKVLFPLDGVVYHDNTYDSKKSINKEDIVDNNIALKTLVNSIPNARKLTGKQIPTLFECDLCHQFKGSQIWNKNGEWFCIYNDKFKELTDENLSNNKRFFESFNEFIEWKKLVSNKLLELEKKAYRAKNMDEMVDIENQIQEINLQSKESDWIESKYIVSVKG